MLTFKKKIALTATQYVASEYTASPINKNCVEYTLKIIDSLPLITPFSYFTVVPSYHLHLL